MREKDIRKLDLFVSVRGLAQEMRAAVQIQLIRVACTRSPVPPPRCPGLNHNNNYDERVLLAITPCPTY